MTLEQLKTIPLLQTRRFSEACKDPETFDYILSCLDRYYKGDYGEVCEDDTNANNMDLAEGYGHVLAKYKARYKLTGDFYIETHFDKDHLSDIDYTQTMLMYPDER